jgi:hypothetical protein
MRETDGHVIYIWSGPKKRLCTVGPDLFNLAVKDRANTFFCLDQYVGVFKKHFEGTATFVYGIEEYIKRSQTKPTNRIKKHFFKNAYLPSQKLKLPILTLIEALIDSAKRHDNPQDKARDLVTIKELFQYYLALYEKNSYLLDANIMPSEDIPTSILPKLKHFTVPKLAYGGVDPWLMYTLKPTKYAKRRLKAYFSIVNKEFMDRKILNQGINRNVLAKAFVNTMIESVDVHTREAKTTFGSDSATILGVRKRYTNSHKKTDLLSPPPMAFLLTGEATQQEIEYVYHETCLSIDTSEPYEYGFEGDFRRSSYLHNAVSKNKHQALALLLPNAVNLFHSIRSNISGKYVYCTPLQLSIEKKYSTCTRLLLEKIIERHFEGSVSLFFTAIGRKVSSNTDVGGYGFFEKEEGCLTGLIADLESDSDNKLYDLLSRAIKKTQEVATLASEALGTVDV